MKLTRRTTIRFILLFIILALGVRGYIGSRSPRLERVDVDLKHLPQACGGLKAAVLTDIHAGPLVPRELVRRGVDMVMAEKPDVIFLTGDFVSGATRFLWTTYGGFRPEDLEGLKAELTRLEAPLGRFAVLGNHDFWSGRAVAGKIEQALTSIGIDVLRNEWVKVSRGDCEFIVAGVDDYWEDSYSLKKATAGIPENMDLILLSHNPDVNEDVENLDRPVDLIVSGHTHGGQIVLPWIGAPYLPSPFGQKYRAGLVRDGERQTYISRGLGVFFVPVRLNCPPEITLLTLR